MKDRLTVIGFENTPGGNEAVKNKMLEEIAREIPTAPPVLQDALKTGMLHAEIMLADRKEAVRKDVLKFIKKSSGVKRSELDSFLEFCKKYGVEATVREDKIKFKGTRKIYKIVEV